MEYNAIKKPLKEEGAVQTQTTATARITEAEIRYSRREKQNEHIKDLPTHFSAISNVFKSKTSHPMSEQLGQHFGPIYISSTIVCVVRSF